MPDARIPHNPSEDQPAEVAGEPKLLPKARVAEAEAQAVAQRQAEGAADPGPPRPLAPPPGGMPHAGPPKPLAPPPGPGEEPRGRAAGTASRPTPSAAELDAVHRITAADGPGSPGGSALLGRAQALA